MILMIINWLIESFKWKLLVKYFEKISFIVAVKSVLFGLTSAIFTPYRLGEYLGRPLMISEDNRFKAISAIFIGSLAQNLVTLAMGATGLSALCFLYPSKLAFTNFKILIIIVSIFISFAVILATYFNWGLIISKIEKSRIYSRWFEKIIFIKNYTKPELYIVLIQSQLRYIVFFCQFYILLMIFDVQIGILEAFSAISLSYLFLFSIPGIPIAEPGIRGSLAIFFIGIFSDNHVGILASTISLWIINLAIPSSIGGLLILKVKKTIHMSPKSLEQ
jgi:hypothetical protein